MKHTALESQACQRQALAHAGFAEIHKWTEPAMIDIGYCIDAPDLLAETLHSTDDGGCSFQWTIGR